MSNKKLIIIPRPYGKSIKVFERDYKIAMKLVEDAEISKVSKFMDDKGLEISYETNGGHGTIFLKNQIGK